MPHPHLLSCFTGICLLLPVATPAAENWVLIGDSLTKEYELEFPALFPDNPSTWKERNWIELLSQHRPDHVDIGPMAFWPDSRLVGHEYNFAFPGSTSSEWEEILTSTIFSNPENVFLRATLDHYLEDVAERVVIFLGGNDLKNNYGTYYDGADPAPFIAKLVSNMRTIVDYVRERNASVPIVLAGMPDVGITPTVQESKPDPDKRLRNTALTREINDRLRALTFEKGIGFADIDAIASQLDGPEHFVIGGVRFFKSVDPASRSNRAQYLFAPDGFHPNTAPQVLFANAIAQGFNEQYSDLTPVPLFPTEEMLTLLNLNPDMPLSEWAAAYAVDASDPTSDADGDGFSLFAEFAMGMDPRIPDLQDGPSGRVTDERFELHYALRLADSAHFTAVPEFSPNLMTWSPVPETQQAVTNNHRFEAWVTPQENPFFLRLTFRSP